MGEVKDLRGRGKGMLNTACAGSVDTQHHHLFVKRIPKLANWCICFGNPVF